MRSLVSVLFLLLAGFGCQAMAGTTYGPNILPNSGFEGGAAAWKMSNPFNVVNDALNAHTGSWELQATLPSTPTYQYCYQAQDVWQNTDYVSTVWVKGSGTFVLGVLNTSNYQFIATVNVTATSDWQQVTLPWNSGAYGNVWLFVYDTVTGNTGTTVYLDDYQTCLAIGNDIQFSPANPAATGYSLKFDDEFNDASSIDVNNTGAPGFHWYVGQYFNLDPTPTSMYSIGGGVLSILNNPPESGMTVHTTEPDAVNGKGFHGTVFTAGAGVYIEARIALPNIASISGSSWPSFWSEDLKLETGLNDQMPGNPSNYENIEEDFMEYNPYWGVDNAYFSTIHDISGTFAPGPNYNISNSNSEIPVAVGTDFSQWHTYGHLWVPASAANGWIGYRQIFFDGVPQAATCWKGYPAGTVPPPGNTPFSLKDHDQFDLIFGGSATGIPSMLVDYVHVYAVSSSSVTVVPPGAPVDVSDLPWVQVANGSGPVEKDASNGGSAAGDGHAISIRGKIYAKGLGCCAPSQITIPLNGLYSSFSSYVGVDDEVGGRGSVRFQAFADTKKIYDSGILSGKSLLQSTGTLNVTGATTLKLVVAYGGARILGHADWATPQLTADNGTPPPAPVGSLAARVISRSQINLSWTSTTGNATSYEVWATANGGAVARLAQLSATARSYPSTGLVANTSYAFFVRALSANGTADSKLVNATTRAR